MAELTISEVARLAGVAASTLRYYEEIGLLPAPRRVSGRRRYDADVLQRIAIIRTAQQAGFTLAEIRVLLDDILASVSPSTQWHALIQRKLQELDAMLLNAQTMKHLLEDIMNCDGDALEECIVLTGERYQT